MKNIQKAVENINGLLIEMHHSGACFIEQRKALVISDLHIGKAGYFRDQGIAIPALANKNNFWKMVEAIEWSEPEEIVFLGDLSHSRENAEWQEFIDFLDQYPNIRKTLIKGNHDILHSNAYLRAKIDVVEKLVIGKTIWKHDLDESDVMSGLYPITGHIHPAVLLTGNARQSMRLPCFYFGEKNGIMPAFGEFTGTALIKPKKGDRVWVIADKKVLAVN
jgi:DNA ligase-associated metallophosphoesterase